MLNVIVMSAGIGAIVAMLTMFLVLKIFTRYFIQAARKKPKFVLSILIKPIASIYPIIRAPLERGEIAYIPTKELVWMLEKESDVLAEQKAEGAH